VLAIVGAGIFAVVWGSDNLGGRADAEGGTCPEGRRTLRVIAPPKLEESLAQAGDKWNAVDRAVDGYCITVEINGADEDEALDAISQQDKSVLAVPGVWIAESADAGDRSRKSTPKRIASMDTPLIRKPGYMLPSIVIDGEGVDTVQDRKSTRLNSSHVKISYAVFCLKKKRKRIHIDEHLKYRRIQIEQKTK